MSNPHSSHGCGITRRGFLLGAAAGAGVTAPLALLGLRAMQRMTVPEQPVEVAKASAPPVAQPSSPLGMPGRYPGRVVEIRHSGAVTPEHQINQTAVDAMVDRGMKELTGADHPQEAWRRFFEPDDVVGIKVNPVGRKPKPEETSRVANAVGSISSPEVILKIVKELKNAGVKPKNILLFERYADEFVNAGYADLMHERIMAGTRWFASAAAYSNTQVDIRGFDQSRDRFSFDLTRRVVGYDPDVFVHMGFASPQHDEKDDRRFRTHCSLLVTKMINKMITIPCLKDHRSAGVTLALKNLSHGMNNNVARSHISDKVRIDGSVSGPNQCNTFIPTAAGQQPIREKATLHIMDGLIGVYEGGPGCWNSTWGTWRHQGLFFATDPVAMDHVGWEIIDAQRKKMGWPAVAAMGLVQESSEVKAARAVSSFAGIDGVSTAMLAAAAKNMEDARRSESFDVRQPQHIILAGEEHGLGVFRRQEPHRAIVIG